MILAPVGMVGKQDVVWCLFVKHYIMKFTQTRGQLFTFKKALLKFSYLCSLHLHAQERVWTTWSFYHIDVSGTANFISV